jgi:hypothetical protein
MSDLLNVDAVAGHNAPPDHGRIAAERMEEEYSKLAGQVDALLDEARTAPTTVTDDETAGILAKLVKRFRDVTAQLKSYHTTEKEPYLRAGQAVDRYFFGLIEKCSRRNIRDKPGAADILQARIDNYQQQKLMAERIRRDEEARLAREAEERIRDERIAQEAAAEEARKAAERARKAENIVAHQATASTHQVAANALTAREDLAREQRIEAQQAAAAKPSEMVGTRLSDDVKVTMRTEGYCNILDVNELDMVALWPFIDDAAKEKACRSWAKTTGYKKQMPGADIGFREKTVIR